MAAKSLHSFMRSQGISLFIHCDIIHQNRVAISVYAPVINSFLIGILKTKEHIWHFRVTESFEESPNIIETNLQQKTSSCYLRL